MCKPNCNPNDCPLVSEGVLVEEAFIEIPVSRYEELIRAETERNVLEAAIEGVAAYNVKDVMGAIKIARRNYESGDSACAEDVSDDA